MALQPLSVGDILMLSQTAWKIGRAFTKGKKSAPSEFLEVEREANGLSEALKLVAETLYADDGIISQADSDTKTAVNTILDSAGRTLSDLESFVERYQVINKKETNGGFVVERSWSQVVLANYKTFKWTTEGGDITELRNMLQMHTNTINLIMQALQSRSLSRLERTVMPMAENIADIHELVNGDLSSKIDDLHRLIMSVANSTPSLQARDRAINGTRSTRSSISTVSTNDPAATPNGTGLRMLEAQPPRPSPFTVPMRQLDRRSSATSSHSSKSTVLAARQTREDSAYYSMSPLPPQRDDRRRMDWDFETGSPPEDRANGYYPGTSAASTASPSGRRESNVARRESTTLPNLFNTIEESDTEDGSNDGNHYAGVSPTSRDPSTFSTTASSSRVSNGESILPPPAIPPDPAIMNSSYPAATPASFLGSPKRDANNGHDNPGPQTVKPVRRSRHDSTEIAGSPKRAESPTFKNLLFRNSAILCDVRGTLVEYAQTNPDERDPRFNTEMREACKGSRICVMRKRENREHGGTKVVTSIWTLSDDGAVRLQQKLSAINETVPYCSYFDPLKVSLPPSEGSGSEIALRFHAQKWGEPLQEEKKTNWVNYVFVSEDDVIAFQSAVFGRTLLGSFHTTKTTVLHEGLKGAFAFEEQFANIEMLRLWEDDGISTPGAEGGVLVLMHVSSNFGEGWARWWLNSSKQQVRVREDGFKRAKVKGIDVTVVTPGGGASVAEKMQSPATAGGGLQRVNTKSEGRPTGGKRIPVRAVTGVKIEFKTEEERSNFVRQCRRVQERLMRLPDL